MVVYELDVVSCERVGGPRGEPSEKALDYDDIGALSFGGIHSGVGEQVRLWKRVLIETLWFAWEEGVEEPFTKHFHRVTCAMKIQRRSII